MNIRPTESSSWWFWQRFSPWLVLVYRQGLYFKGSSGLSAPYGPWAEWQINAGHIRRFNFQPQLSVCKKNWWATAYTWQINIECSDVSKKKTKPAPPESQSSPQSWMCSGFPQQTCLFLRIECSLFSNQSPPLILLARALQVRSKRPWW